MASIQTRLETLMATESLFEHTSSGTTTITVNWLQYNIKITINNSDWENKIKIDSTLPLKC